MRYGHCSAASLCVGLMLAWIGLAMPAAAQPTFSVEGRGQGTTRLNVSLEPGSGVSRGALIAISRFIQRDLHSTGLFTVAVLPPGATGRGGWNSAGSEDAYTVRLAAEKSGAGQTVALNVTDSRVGGQAFQRKFQVSQEDPPLVGHTVSDILYQYFVGREGYFATKIAYVRRTKANGRNQWQIASSYADGSDLRVLATSSTEMSSPTLAPDGSVLVYVRFNQDRPQLYMSDFRSNRSGPVFRDREVRFGPEIGPNGTLFYTKVVNGNADIYSTRLDNRREKRLTYAESIETESSVSADGTQLAYISDGAGSPRVVVHDLSSGARRTVVGAGYYGTPTWSPDGKMLAFTRQGGGKFSIGTLDLETLEEKVISSSFFEEHPTWAKNGRVLLFERAERQGRRGGGRSSLWHVDLDSGRLYRLPLETSATDPTWIR